MVSVPGRWPNENEPLRQGTTLPLDPRREEVRAALAAIHAHPENQEKEKKEEAETEVEQA